MDSPCGPTHSGGTFNASRIETEEFGIGANAPVTAGRRAEVRVGRMFRVAATSAGGRCRWMVCGSTGSGDGVRERGSPEAVDSFCFFAM